VLSISGAYRPGNRRNLEATVLTALRAEKPLLPHEDLSTDREIVGNLIDRIEVSQNKIRIALKTSNEVAGSHVNANASATDATDQTHTSRHIDIPWRPNSKGPLARIEEKETRGNDPDTALVQAVARARSWTQLLLGGEHASIESLAVSINMHPKVVRKSIRLAFLAPEITEAIILGRHVTSLTLSDLQQTTSLSWVEQRRKLGISERVGNLQPARPLSPAAPRSSTVWSKAIRSVPPNG